MTAPKIGGVKMAALAYDTSDGNRVAYMWRSIVGPFSVVVGHESRKTHASSVRFIQTPSVNGINNQSAQEAADAASDYLRGVALEILATVDQEAAGRVKGKEELASLREKVARYELALNEIAAYRHLAIEAGQGIDDKDVEVLEAIAWKALNP